MINNRDEQWDEPGELMGWRMVRMVIFDGEPTKKHHKLELMCFLFSPVKNISVSVKLGFLMGLVRYPGTEQQKHL